MKCVREKVWYPEKMISNELAKIPMAIQLRVRDGVPMDTFTTMRDTIKGYLWDEMR